ncbi:MAG: transporter [Bryobacteraceae bacterium]
MLLTNNLEELTAPGSTVPLVILARRFKFAAVLLFLAVCLRTPIRAQEHRGAPPAPSPVSSAPSIQDNSFLIEEAYNQEPYVVQHITSYTRFWNSRDAVASFTQEWPVPEHARHQLSYTLVGVSAGAFPGSGFGLGDIALNYRYQVVGGGETRVAFAPRLSVLLPTGQTRLGRGSGGVGVQVDLPLSIVLARQWVTHSNVGTTLIPSARNERGERAAVTGYNLGQSVVFLARPRFNLMLETLWTGSESVVTPGRTQRTHGLLISPGVRWAYNLRGRLQIVPGVAVPLGVGPSAGERGLFFYLSFEHPFGKGRNAR